MIVATLIAVVAVGLLVLTLRLRAPQQLPRRH
jgi:hypothetical protein